MNSCAVVRRPEQPAAAEGLHLSIAASPARRPLACQSPAYSPALSNHPTNLVYPCLRLLATACRYVFAVKLAPGQQLRRVLPATEADAERLMRYLADSE
jgi:hypothetical protein